ncbi:indole-3-glycerol phosphate synthase TrpC [Breznakiellaceae bacterium SP9]
MILDTIAASTRIRVEKAKKERPLEAVQAAIPMQLHNSFERSLSGHELSFICEVKKASPSKGIIACDTRGGFPYLELAYEYKDAGAAAISVLTEPAFFLGSDEYLQDIARRVQLPVLRKDFVIDPYQIYEAKTLGAAAVLLICALLDTKTLEEYIAIAHKLGLAALVEAHSEDEVCAAVDCGARIIGINNRDLRTFTVDLATTARLRKRIPPDVLTVSESGIRSKEDIRDLTREGPLAAVLIGETLITAKDKKACLTELRSGVCRQ